MKTKRLLITHLLFCLTVILFAGCDKEKEFNETPLIGTSLKNYEMQLRVNPMYPGAFSGDNLVLETLEVGYENVGILTYKRLFFDIANPDYFADLVNEWYTSPESILSFEVYVVTVSGKFVEGKYPSGKDYIKFIIEDVNKKD